MNEYFKLPDWTPPLCDSLNPEKEPTRSEQFFDKAAEIISPWGHHQRFFEESPGKCAMGVVYALRGLMEEMRTPIMDRIQVLNVKAGDVVVIRLCLRISKEAKETLAAQVKANLPSGVGVMVMDEGLEVSAVLKQDEGSDPV